MRCVPMLSCVVGLCLAASPAGALEVQGDYIEARTADVYTGPCFSNSEAFITGNQAVMAWRVRQGGWQGVDLSGLTVAAAVRGTTTFSLDDPRGAQAILMVDQRASADQRQALVAMARHLGGERLSHIVDVRATRMSLLVEDHEAPLTQSADLASHHAILNAPKAAFWAAGMAEIVTRPLDESDHACGNEVVAYPPLSEGVKVLPAYTMGHRFRGLGLNTTWNDPNCRSSFVGRFEY